MEADGTEFVMAVNVDVVSDDLEQARLTNAHEFAHIITQTDFELDRDVIREECATYWNGFGCFELDSLMWAWMSEFWDPTVLAGIDPDAELFVADGDERCATDDSYFGAYAASNPEEDFAETFSAFVYGVEPATPGQTEKLLWLESQPGLAEFRERAEFAGLAPTRNDFEVCG